MKKLKIAVNISFILAILSALAMILLFLALSDIANNEPDVTLEWYITGISMMVLSAFIISTIVTLALLFKKQEWR